MVPGTEFLDKFLSRKRVPGTGGMDAGWDDCCKTAGMPFYSSARDWSGILICRRQKRYKRKARSVRRRRMDAPKSGKNSKACFLA
jgi:hypothetical protein